MSVNTTLASLSQTAALNGPDGAVDPPSSLDDALRYHGAFIAMLRDGSGFSYALSSRNRLMNGNFQINQRAVSGTVTLAAGAYGHDRWKAGASGCTYTFAASGKDATITISAGSLMQVIEDKNVEGGVYALQNAGTAQARIAVNGAATSGAYAAATNAAPLASASATGNQTMTVEFTTGTVSKAQMEPGAVATPFERRPYGAELALCQRYYWRGLPGLGFNYPSYASGAVMAWPIRLPQTMRAVPTLSITAPGITLSGTAAPTLGTATADGFRLLTTSTGIAANTAFTFAATDFIEAAAEL